MYFTQGLFLIGSDCSNYQHGCPLAAVTSPLRPFPMFSWLVAYPFCRTADTERRAVFLALSSCLGERFRARVSGFSINPRHGSYDHTYFRTIPNAGPASSEHIEMETMLNERGLHSDDDI